MQPPVMKLHKSRHKSNTKITIRLCLSSLKNYPIFISGGATQSVCVSDFL